MTKYKIASTYKNWKIIKIENGKALVENKCDCCGGSGIMRIIAARVENGRTIPIPVDCGICYKCEGNGKIQKWVKAYIKE